MQGHNTMAPSPGTRTPQHLAQFVKILTTAVQRTLPRKQLCLFSCGTSKNRWCTSLLACAISLRPPKRSETRRCVRKRKKWKIRVRTSTLFDPPPVARIRSGCPTPSSLEWAFIDRKRPSTTTRASSVPLSCSCVVNRSATQQMEMTLLVVSVSDTQMGRVWGHRLLSQQPGLWVTATHPMPLELVVSRALQVKGWKPFHTNIQQAVSTSIQHHTSHQ